MRLFKWKEHQKKWRNHPPNKFMFSFFVEENPSMEVNPPMFMFMFFLWGKIPYQWRFIARWENPLAKSDGILRDTRGELMFLCLKKTLCLLVYNLH